MYYTWNQNKYYRPVTEIRSDMFVDLLRNMRTWALDSAVSNRVDVAVKTLALRVFKRWPSEPEIMLIERTTVHTQPTVYGVAPDGYMRLPS
jgi:hypothetical protein